MQAFADRPIEQMVDEYDLMVIDYPHVGEVSAKGLLQQFDVQQYNDQLDILNEQSVGLSHQSYNIDGHQWALAIDAATQVSCYREDLIDDVLKLDNGSEVQISKYPNNHGKIKSPLCCGEDMSCNL